MPPHPTNPPLHPFSLMSCLYLTPLYVFSHSPCALYFCSSIALFAPVFLADTVHSHWFQPLQWLHGLATQLGAHYLLIHRLKDRQRQPVPFLSSTPPPLPSLYLSLSLFFSCGHFLSKRVLFLGLVSLSLISSYPLLQHNEPACAKKN